MDEERHGNVKRSESPESPFSKSSKQNNSNSNSNTNTNTNKEQDRFLPIANVGRIMKKVIPGNGKISKEAKETVQECVSEFISFVTGEASDKCQREKRKTINGDDILWAITSLGFEDYVAPLKLYLSKHREIENERMNNPKQQQQQTTSEQQQQQQPHPCYSNNDNVVYSSTGTALPNPLMSQPSFDQSFSLNFSPPNSTQKQLHEQDQIDPVAHW